MIVILEGNERAVRAYRRPDMDGAEWGARGVPEPGERFELTLEDAAFPKLARGFVEFTQGCVLTGPLIGEIYGALQRKFSALGFQFRRRIFEMSAPSGRVARGDKFDAGAYWKALCARAEREGLADPRVYVAQVARWSTGTSFIARAEFDAIPARPGVYRFFDEEGRLLYVGKSISLRKRVLDHLQGTQLDAKDRKLKARAVRIEWDETGSDLLALLRESEEIQTRHPILNRAQRRRRTLVSIVVEPTSEGYLRLGMTSGPEPAEDRPAARERQVIALPSRGSARALLDRLRRDHGLCDELCGHDNARRFVWPPGRPCFGCQIGRCAGACAGTESVESYNLRVREIVQRLRAEIGGSFMLVAEGRHERERGFAWVQDGRYLGWGFVGAGALDGGFVARARAALRSQADTRDARRILKAFLNASTESIIKISLET